MPSSESSCKSWKRCRLVTYRALNVRKDGISETMEHMSIRESMQASVDEFIANLESYATGSYLRENEKEFWEQPFDPAVLPELRSIVEAFLDSLDRLGDEPSQEAIHGVVNGFIDRTQAFDDTNAGAVIEPEEENDLNLFIHRALEAGGFDEETIASTTEFE